MSFIELYEQKKSDKEIAQALGIQPGSVKRMRQRKGLKSNSSTGRPRTRERKQYQSYKQALPPEKWEEIRLFLRVMTTVKRYGGGKGVISRVVNEWHKRGCYL